MTYIIRKKRINLRKDRTTIIPIDWNVVAENVLIELEAANCLVYSSNNSVSIRVEDAFGRSFVQQAEFPLDRKSNYFDMHEFQTTWIPKRIKLRAVDFDEGSLAISIGII